MTSQKAPAARTRLRSLASVVVADTRESMRRQHLPPDERALLMTTRSGPLLIRASEFLAVYLERAKRQDEVRRRVDTPRAAEWVVRMFFSLASMPSYQVDIDDPEDVRNFVREFVLRGLA